MRISVIGAGYVGLTTAACLAQIGHEVFCSESNADKLKKLQSGVIPIFEPDLEEIVESARKRRCLIFGSTEEAIDRSEVIFICVGTPPLSNGDADLSAIEAVARLIAKRASGYRLVIEKSTVPVQTGCQLQRYLSIQRTGSLEYDVVSNPEFLREGSAVYDFLHPDRIVVGVTSSSAAERMKAIYAPVINQSFSCPLHAICPERERPPIVVTDTNSAELIKHASNSFLAMKISFINMIADLCEAAGADVTGVAQGMGLDPRIGSAFLKPGIGFGGFCFPKDLQAFIRIAEKLGCDFSLLKQVESINKRRVEVFLDKVRRELWVVGGKKIAIWGLAFKPNTDDIRFAPSVPLLKALMNDGAIVSAYDPQAMSNAKEVLPEVRYCANPYEAAADADAILILTEWEEFRNLDWDRVHSLVERRLVIDGRNMFPPRELACRGFRHVSVGRPPAMPTADFVETRQREMSAISDSGVICDCSPQPPCQPR